jgi:hypothetical protein
MAVMSIQAEQTELDVSKHNRAYYPLYGGISSAAIYYIWFFPVRMVDSGFEYVFSHLLDKDEIRQNFEALALTLLVGFPAGALGGWIGGSIFKSKIVAMIGGIIFGIIPPTAVVLFIINFVLSGG